MKDLNIRHFKLVSGDDLLALTINEAEDHIVIERPIIMHPAGGTSSYQFSVWFPFSTQSVFKLKRINIIEHSLVDDDIKKTYIEYALQTNDNVIEPDYEEEYNDHLTDGDTMIH